MAAKRWTSEQRERLGAQLTERREELDPRYYVRDVFAAERGINLRMAADIEKGRPRNFTPLTLRDVIARAYAVEYRSIYAALDGADLEAAPGSPPRRTAQRPAQAPPPSADGGWLPPLGADAIARARPYADSVFMARADWRAAYAAAHPGIAVSDIPEPPGADLFGADSPDARTWDDRAAVMSVEERVWLIAALRAREANARQRESAG